MIEFVTSSLTILLSIVGMIVVGVCCGIVPATVIGLLQALMRRIRLSRSQCPHCQNSLRWMDVSNSIEVAENESINLGDEALKSDLQIRVELPLVVKCPSCGDTSTPNRDGKLDPCHPDLHRRLSEGLRFAWSANLSSERTDGQSNDLTVQEAALV